MKTRRRRLHATMFFLLFALDPSPVWAGSSEPQSGGTGMRLAEMTEKASTDSRGQAELSRVQEGYVERATREWRDGTERKKLHSSLRMASEAAEAMSTRIRQSGLLERAARLETTAKEAGARLSARWERERAAREREREQRERDAGERAREQRR